MQEERRGVQHGEEGIPNGACQEQALTDLDRKAAALTEGQWKALQLGGGAALGICGGLCLFYLGATETFGSISLLLALGLLLLLPSYLQRSLRRSIHLGRMASMAAFALFFLAYAAWNWPK